MKILYLPLNWPPGHSTQQGFYDAFTECGLDLQVFDFMTEFHNERKRTNTVRAKFIDHVKRFSPDLLFLQIQHTSVIDAASVSKVKRHIPHCKIIQWTSDVRNRVEPTYKAIAAVADYNFICSTGQLQMYADALGKPVKYLQIGYNPKLYFPEQRPRENYTWDISFVAHYNRKEQYPGRAERETVCRMLRNEFGDRFCLYGDGWPKDFGAKGSIEQQHVATVYHQSRCVLSVSHFNDINHYFSDRLLMCLACGRPTIIYRFPQWESYFTHKCDALIANSLDEIPKLVRMMMKDDEMANYIGKSGAEKAFSEHTYKSRVQELLEIIK